MTETPDWEKALAEYGAEAVDLTQIPYRTQQRDDRPLAQIQKIALEQMEQIDKRCDEANVVRVGGFYWITHPQTGELHLACDTAPISVVKILGMEGVQRIYHEAKKQEHS